MTGVYLGILAMPVAQPSPTEQKITLYVAAYIRKYLVARLADNTRKLSDDSSRTLFDELQARLNGRKLLEVENDYDPSKDLPQQRVVLRVEAKPWHTAELDLTSHQQVCGYLGKTFLKEMYAWVDWYRSRLGMSTRKALALFRRNYGINEEDHAFLSAERLYHKHCKLTGQSRPPRGRKRRKAIRS